MSTIDDVSAARQTAARLAAITDIRDVRLMKSSVEMLNLPAAAPLLAYEFDSESAVEYEPGSESFVVRGKYHVSISSRSSDEGEDLASTHDSAVAQIDFEQAALFVIDMTEAEPPKAEELKAYAVSTGQFALHPYVREYISDVTMRLGLPPLTVGVLKLPITNGVAHL